MSIQKKLRGKPLKISVSNVDIAKIISSQYNLVVVSRGGIHREGTMNFLPVHPDSLHPNCISPIIK